MGARDRLRCSPGDARFVRGQRETSFCDVQYESESIACRVVVSEKKMLPTSSGGKRERDRRRNRTKKRKREGE